MIAFVIFTVYMFEWDGIYWYDILVSLFISLLIYRHFLTQTSKNKRYCFLNKQSNIVTSTFKFRSLYLLKRNPSNSSPFWPTFTLENFEKSFRKFEESLAHSLDNCGYIIWTRAGSQVSFSLTILHPISSTVNCIDNATLYSSFHYASDSMLFLNTADVLLSDDWLTIFLISWCIIILKVRRGIALSPSIHNVV